MPRSTLSDKLIEDQLDDKYKPRLQVNKWRVLPNLSLKKQRMSSKFVPRSESNNNIKKPLRIWAKGAITTNSSDIAIFKFGSVVYPVWCTLLTIV